MFSKGVNLWLGIGCFGPSSSVLTGQPFDVLQGLTLGAFPRLPWISFGVSLDVSNNLQGKE